MIEQYGLEGWGEIEVPIIVAMASGMAICFKGGHGGAKTFGAKALAEAALGKVIKDMVTGEKREPRGKAYSCPNTNFDEMLGILSPQALKEGKIEFIKTGTSVWEVDWILADEINRVNPLIGGKWMELILDGSINGQKTGVIYRFSAINPPGNGTGYNSQPMDLAAASRFCFIDVPEACDLDESGSMDAVFDSIFEGRNKDQAEDPFALKKLIRLIQDGSAKMEKVDAKAIWHFIVKVQKTLNTRDGHGKRSIKFSIRQMRQLWEMTKCFVQIEKHAPDLNSSSESHVNMIMGMVPELNEVIQGIKIDVLAVRQQLLELVESEFVGSDPIAKARTLNDLAKINASDELRYTEEFQRRVLELGDVQEMATALGTLRKSGKSKNIIEPCTMAIRAQCVRISLEDTCGSGSVTAEAIRKVENDVNSILK